MPRTGFGQELGSPGPRTPRCGSPQNLQAPELRATFPKGLSPKVSSHPSSSVLITSLDRKKCPLCPFLPGQLWKVLQTLQALKDHLWPVPNPSMQSVFNPNLRLHSGIQALKNKMLPKPSLLLNLIPSNL